MVGSSESVSYMAQLIVSGQVVGLEADMWMTTLSFIQKPTLDMLREVKVNVCLTLVVSLSFISHISNPFFFSCYAFYLKKKCLTTHTIVYQRIGSVRFPLFAPNALVFVCGIGLVIMTVLETYRRCLIKNNL